MKKTLILISLIVLIAAVYSGFWWHKSNELKERVETALDEISKDENNNFALKYDSLERKGFPFTVELAFTNPQLIYKNNPSKVVQTGMVIVGSSIFEKEKIWIKASGTTDILAVQNSENPQHLRISGNSYFKCDYCGKHRGLLKTILRFKKDWDPLLTASLISKWIPIILRDSTINVKDFNVTQASKEQPNTFHDVLNVKEGYFNVKNKDADGYYHFSVDVNAEKMTFTNPQSIDDLHTIFPNSNKDELRQTFLDLGSFNMTFQAHGSLPTFDHPFYKNPSLENMPNFSFVVDKSNRTSELDNLSAKGLIEFEKLPENKFKGLLAAIEQWKATELLHAKVVKAVEVIAKEKVNDGVDPKRKELEKLIIEQSNDLVPDFTKFGTFVFQINSEVNGQRGSTPNHIEQGIFDLKILKVACDLYGLDLSGKLEKKLAGAYTSFLDIQIINYRDLFRDMANYYNKWQKIVVKSHQTNAESLPVISQAFVDRFSQFLESLSTKPESSTLDIPIYYEDSDHIKIGTKSLNDATADWTQTHIDLKNEIIKANPPTKVEEPKVEEQQKAAA